MRWILVWLLICWPAAAYTATVTIGASKDNTLYESAAGNLSNGAGEYFFVGRTATGQIRRGLIRFNVRQAVPPGSVINSVVLRLSMSQTNVQAGPQMVTLHRVAADWGEGTSNATANEGSGTLATPGDATWLHRFYDQELWATPGGDFSATAKASAQVGGIGSYQWGSTSPMVADVQGWLDSPLTNYGWLIRGNETSSTTAKRFGSSENLLTSARPQLTIDYTLPAGPVKGDVNGDAALDLGDVFYLINFLFSGGPAPVVSGEGDMNADGATDVIDVLYLLNHLFGGGPGPV